MGDTGYQEQLSKLAELLTLTSEQDEFRDLLGKIPSDVVNVTNIGNGGTLLQRAASLEKVAEVGFLLEVGADPKVLPAADGEVNDPDDDDVVNLSPLSIAVKKNNYEMWSLMINRPPYNTTNPQFLEQLFDIIEWVGPNVASSPKDYEDFKKPFKDMVTYPSLKEVSETCIRETGTLFQQAVRSECYEYVQILANLGVDPGFVTETGKLRKSPIEMASEKNQEIFLLLTKKKLLDLMHQDDKETAKEEFAKLLKTIPSKSIGETSVGKHERIAKLKNYDSAHPFETLLQEAARWDKPNFVHLLLKHGVNPIGVVNKEKKETDLVWDSDREGDDQKQRTPVEIALLAGRVEVLALLAEFTELPESQKLEYLQLMMESDREVSLEEFKKQIQSLPLEKLNEEKIEFHEHRRGLHTHTYIYKEKVKGTWVQYLATMKTKAEMLEILLELGFDPNGVHMPSMAEPDTCMTGCLPIEIAAMTGNAKAFKLLAPHCKDELKKKLTQLVFLGLREKAPSDEFKTLFASMSKAELCGVQGTVEDVLLANLDRGAPQLAELRKNNPSVLIEQVTQSTVQGASLLQIFSLKGKTAHVAFLLEQGLDPEVITQDEPHPAMWHAWEYDNVATMAELLKYTEPSMEIRNSPVWGHVEKERERFWQKEMIGLLKQQNKILTHVAKSSGVDANEILN